MKPFFFVGGGGGTITTMELTTGQQLVKWIYTMNPASHKGQPGYGGGSVLHRNIPVYWTKYFEKII